MRLERDELSEVSLQYLTALLMNMTLKRAGQERCEKEHILQLLVDLLELNSDEIKTYVCGSIYSLMCSANNQAGGKAYWACTSVGEICDHFPE